MFWKVLLATVVLSFGVRPAHAYIDPGSAILVLQGIVGAIAAGFVVFRDKTRKLLSFFTRRKSSPSQTHERQP